MTCSVLGFTQDTPVSSRARSLQSSALVVDAHEDTPQRFLDENYDIGSTDSKDEEYISLDKARAGNLGAEFFSIWAYPKTKQGHLAKRTLDLIDSVYEQAARHPDRMMMAFSAKDIERAHKEQKLAALMGIEGGHSIENDIRLLRQYYRLGVRYMTLTWSNSNEWADSSGDLDDLSVQHHNGLTEFGKQVVLEMNRLGMIVDISHVSDKTFWDTIAISKAPVIASHSSARALVNVARNMNDDMLRAVSKNGGVVCVNFFADFVDQDFLRAAEAQHQKMVFAVENYVKERKAAGSGTDEDRGRFERAWLAENTIPRAPLKALIDNIDHLVKIAGVDHVGLGSDFDGRNFLPDGIDSAADLPRITQSLLDRGYNSDDIKKILGRNIIRVFREVERVSHEM
jgi:membrane dipeptidase